MFKRMYFGIVVVLSTVVVLICVSNFDNAVGASGNLTPLVGNAGRDPALSVYGRSSSEVIDLTATTNSSADGSVDFAVTVTGEEAADYESPSLVDSKDGQCYEIRIPAQLDFIRTDLSACYRLGANISLSSYDNWTPIGFPDMSFTGTIDGNGYKITGLKINMENETGIGLFHAISGGTINNLVIENVDVFGRNTVGGIAGFITEGTLITNSYVTGNVSSLIGFSGGMVGQTREGSKIINSFNKANINSASYNAVNDIQRIGPSGGITGAMSNSTILNSYNAGNVVATNPAGGIVGLMTASTVTNSYNTGDVSSTVAGGIVGRMGGGDDNTVINCYNTGVVNIPPSMLASGETLALGGIVGNIMSGTNGMSATIKNCATFGHGARMSDGLRILGDIKDGEDHYSSIFEPFLIFAKIIGNTEVRISRDIRDAEEFYAHSLDSLSIANNFSPDVLPVLFDTVRESFVYKLFYGTAVNETHLKNQTTYSDEIKNNGEGGLGWEFGNSDETPWKMPEGDGLPILYWQVD